MCVCLENRYVSYYFHMKPMFLAFLKSLFLKLSKIVIEPPWYMEIYCMYCITLNWNNQTCCTSIFYPFQLFHPSVIKFALILDLLNILSLLVQLGTSVYLFFMLKFSFLVHKMFYWLFSAFFITLFILDLHAAVVDSVSTDFNQDCHLSEIVNVC